VARAPYPGPCENLGAIIIDADEVAHAIIEPGKPAWEDIVEHFGTEVLNPDQTIDREKLGAIVFNDPARVAGTESNHSSPGGGTVQADD
jgi:dephospho-CoA kinase